MLVATHQTRKNWKNQNIWRADFSILNESKTHKELRPVTWRYTLRLSNFNKESENKHILYRFNVTTAPAEEKLFGSPLSQYHDQVNHSVKVN